MTPVRSRPATLGLALAALLLPLTACGGDDPSDVGDAVRDAGGSESLADAAEDLAEDLPADATEEEVLDAVSSDLDVLGQSLGMALGAEYAIEGETVVLTFDDGDAELAGSRCAIARSSASGISPDPVELVVRYPGGEEVCGGN